MRLDRPTYREQEVLVALVEHHTDQGIADALGLSLGCVRAHLAHLRDKTGTENRVQLLRWALREARKGYAGIPVGRAVRRGAHSGDQRSGCGGARPT